MAEQLRDNQYQGAIKILNGANDAIAHAVSGCKRKEEPRTIRRRIEEVESLCKKAKRELGM